MPCLKPRQRPSSNIQPQQTNIFFSKPRNTTKLICTKQHHTLHIHSKYKDKYKDTKTRVAQLQAHLGEWDITNVAVSKTARYEGRPDMDGQTFGLKHIHDGKLKKLIQMCKLIGSNSYFDLWPEYSDLLYASISWYIQLPWQLYTYPRVINHRHFRIWSDSRHLKKVHNCDIREVSHSCDVFAHHIYVIFNFMIFQDIVGDLLFYSRLLSFVFQVYYCWSVVVFQDIFGCFYWSSVVVFPGYCRWSIVVFQDIVGDLLLYSRILLVICCCVPGYCWWCVVVFQDIVGDLLLYSRISLTGKVARRPSRADLTHPVYNLPVVSLFCRDLKI